jgi:hypothetical protein
MMVHLSVVESGENCKSLEHYIHGPACSLIMHASIGLNKSFTFDRGFAPIPGWELSVTWLAEEGLPKKGLLCFEMFAGDGIQLLGCKVDTRLRQLLSALVLVDQRDYLSEMHRQHMLQDEKYVDQSVVGSKTNAHRVHGLDKLNRQMAILFRLNDYEEVYEKSDDAVGHSTVPSGVQMRVHTAEDTNKHLHGSTDITWSYTDNHKFESWLVME